MSFCISSGIINRASLKHLFLISILILFCQSCGLVEISGYYNDYDKLTDAQKAVVHDFSGFDNAKLGCVYKIDIEQLKAELAIQPKSMVYLFSSCNCGECIPLSVYEQYANDNGYNIIFVLRDYHELGKTLEQNIAHPIFVIDNDYYHENRRFIYERYFLNDLLGNPTKTKYKDIPEELQMASLFFYEKGKLVKTLNKLPN